MYYGFNTLCFIPVTYNPIIISVVPEPLEDLKTVCNRTLSLSVDQPRAAVTSPGFPRTYPDNAECHTLVTVPPGYRIIVEFDELILEEERLE